MLLERFLLLNNMYLKVSRTGVTQVFFLRFRRRNPFEVHRKLTDPSLLLLFFTVSSFGHDNYTSTSTMKVLSLLSTALVATHAFSPLATTRTATTEVSMAASSFEPDRTGWRNKPIAHKGDRSTPSVASPKAASWLERQTMGSVMIDPDYFLAVAVFLLGPLIMWYHPCTDRRALLSHSGVASLTHQCSLL